MALKPKEYGRSLDFHRSTGVLTPDEPLATIYIGAKISFRPLAIKLLDSGVLSLSTYNDTPYGSVAMPVRLTL
jgi:hypothetical protein